jgi:hypothetical protein
MAFNLSTVIFTSNMHIISSVLLVIEVTENTK